MKPNTQITEGLLDNKIEFNDQFYQRFNLREAKEPLKLNENVSKNYLFPTLYGDVAAAMAIFFCNYQKAKELLPDPNMKPVSMGKDRALVIFSCYEYKKVLGVRPYNEIAMTIPVLNGDALNLPVLPIVIPNYKGFGYYCFRMPVTSLENQIRGVKIWGLPKVVEEIDISYDEKFCHVNNFDENGESYLKLKIPLNGKNVKFDVSSFLFTKIDSKINRSITNFVGDFKINKNMKSLVFNSDYDRNDTFIEIGKSPNGKILRELEIDPNPFQFRYCKKMQASFDLPLN